MFTSLSPLLGDRSLLVTLASIGDNNIRATVSIDYKDKKKKTPAPLQIDGTAEELDAKFAEILADYRSKVLTFEESLNEVQTQLDADLKAAKDEAAAKLAASRKAKSYGRTVTQASTAAVTKPEPAPETKAPALGLFDPSPATAGEATTTPVKEETPTDATQSEAA